MKNKTNLNLLCSKLKLKELTFILFQLLMNFLMNMSNYNMRLRVTNFSGSMGMH